MTTPRAVLLGIGRRGDGDDALGPVFARAFRHPRWVGVDAATAPENFGPLLRRLAPPLIAVLDAARMGLPPGTVRFLDPASLDAAGFGTHAPDSVLLDGFLRIYAPRTLWIGIQPASLTPGTFLSPPVKAALRSLPPLLPSDF
ncbi:MAG: hydrogenase maturation protease [Kiritimatiellae bacterium]|nr:hydrogenase maturation protease [Kiritimatiellia bacterium]